MAGGNAIHGARVGASTHRERLRGPVAPRTPIDFHCVNGHTTRLAFADDAEIPEIWDCPNCGSPAGRDAGAPPPAPRAEPYKTHLAYVKERRTDAEGEALLAEALARVAERRTPRSMGSATRT